MKMLNNKAKIKFTFRLVESYKKSFKKRMIYFEVNTYPRAEAYIQKKKKHNG
jgi:hypothetical protein